MISRVQQLLKENMLEPHERLAFHVVIGPVVLAFCMYVGMFLDGIVDGWKVGGEEEQ